MGYWRQIAISTTVFLALSGAKAWAELLSAPFNEPDRITSHPAEDYMPAISPDGHQMVFVSNRAGAPNLWIKSVGDPSLPTPKQLTDQAAGDKDPAFSPDGKKIVYVSYGSDSDGDIYILTLPKPEEIATGATPYIERLTGMETGDREPLFTSDGKGIIFSSWQKTGGQRAELFLYDLKTKQRRRLTKGGGRHADLSSDGEKIVFVASAKSVDGESEDLGESALYVLDMKTGHKRRITSGFSADSFPVFDGSGAVVFVRYQSDTNGDGAVTVDDNPALFRKNLKTPNAPSYPITPHENYNLFPATAGAKLYYSAHTKKGVDIYTVASTGFFTPSTQPKADFVKAKSAALYYTKRPGLRQLAWRVFTSAHATCKECKEILAEGLYRLAKEEQKAKDTTLFRKHFSDVITLYPKVMPWAGFSEIELATFDLSDAHLLKKLGAIKKKYRGEKRVEAIASIHMARSLVASGKAEKALPILRHVVTKYSDQRQEAAQATFERNSVYQLTGERDKLIAVYLDVLRSYPDQEKWALLAVQKILDLAVVEGDVKATALALGRIINRDDSPKALKAAAMNKTAALYWEADDPARARKTYQITVDEYPDQRREKNEALFSIAKILAAEERYKDALKIYRKIGQDTDNKREVYLSARKAYIAQSLKKAKYEKKSGDIRLALKTYHTLTEYDPSITEANRGVIRLKAALGKTEEVVSEYKNMLAEKPDDDLLMYSLGLALTYREPPTIEQAEKLIGAAISKNENNPWYHQTLGWIYERRENEKRDGSFAQLALERYLHALALTDSAKHPEREADLRLNLGNVSHTLKNCAIAVENYSRRQALGFAFDDTTVASWFYQRWGECQFRLGDDKGAIHLFGLSQERAGSDPYRLIELHERTALAQQSSGYYREAADRFRKSLKLRQSVGFFDGEEVVTRNIANNLYFESENAPSHERNILKREALGFYLISEKKLSEKKPTKKKSGGGALINIDVKTGAGGIGASSSGGFSIAEEQKLLFHHIGQIYGELGEYEKAAEYFEKKLSLIPRALVLLGNAPVLTEKSIILNQLGVYLSRSGDGDETVKRFIESLKICRKLGSSACVVKNVDNMARIALDDQKRISTETFDTLIDEGGVSLLEALEGSQDIIATASALNHYGQLHHKRFKQTIDKPAALTAEEMVASITKAATDANYAEEFYAKSRELYKSVKNGDGRAATLRTSINIAALFADLGRHAEANTLFDEIISEGENRLASDVAMFTKVSTYAAEIKFDSDSEKAKRAYDEAVDYTKKFATKNGDKPLLPGPVWEAFVTRYLYYPDDPNSTNWLKAARRTLVAIPFGYKVGENREYTFALITALYHGLAKNVPNHSPFDLDEEKGAVIRRFILADILESKVTDKTFPEVGTLHNLYKEYQLIRELAAAGVEGSSVHYAKWRLKETRIIASLIASNRLLFDTVYTSTETPEFIDDSSSPLNVLESHEAALAWRHESNSVVSFVIFSQDGIIKERHNVKIGEGETIVNFLTEKGFTHLYLVSDRPFSGPPLPHLFSDKLTITAVPSLFMIPHIKAAQNINDYRLVATGVDKKVFAEVEETFVDVSIFPDKRGDILDHDSLKGAGVLLFDTISTDGGTLNKVRFGKDEISVDAQKLLLARHDASLLLTPQPSSGNMEGALFSLALLAGYPSWIVIPDENEKRDSFLKVFLTSLRKTSIAQALKIAKAETKSAATLTGAFGLSENERTEFAANGFKEEVGKAVTAMKNKSWAEAVDSFERAHIFTTITGNKRYEAPLFNWMAEALFQIDRYEDAMTYQQKLITIYREKGEGVKLAKALLLSGAIYTKLDRYDEAVSDIGEALDIFRQAGDADSIIEASSQLGAAEEGHRRYGRALTAFGSALDTSREAGSKIKSADALRRVGRVYHLRLNRFDRAREAFTKSIALYEEEGEEKRAIAVMIDLASADVDAGALAKAETILNKALIRADNIDDKKLTALATFHLSNVAWFRGNYSQSLEWVDKSIALAEKRDAKNELVMSYSTKGLVYWSLNDYPKATEALEQSLATAREIGAKLDEASALNNLGLVKRSAGLLGEAKSSFETALAIDQKLKSDWGVAYDTRNLSIVFLMMGDIKTAEKMGVEAVRLTNKIGDKINGAKALLQLANVNAAKKKWPETISNAREARTMATKGGIAEVLWRAHRVEGKALYATGKKDDAVYAYKKGVEVVENLRASIKSENLRHGFLDDKQDLYEELILLLIEQKKVKEAFSFAERARARGFIDLLGKTPPKLKTKAEIKEYKRIKNLQARVDELSRADSAAMSERDEAALQLSAAIDKIRINHPELLPFVSVEPVSADQTLEALGDKTALLEYVVTKRKTILFIAGAGKIDAVLLPITKNDLAKRVIDYRLAIQDGAPVEENPKFLGKLLLGQAMKKIEQFDVIGIAPHGPLHYLSFAATRIDGSWLIDKKPIFYVPSASVFMQTKARRSQDPPAMMSALAVGDPDLGNYDSELPLAQLEAKSLKWIFPKVTTLTRKDATESSVTQKAENYQIVHIASHALYDTVAPLDSALYLTADKNKDGALMAKEIFSMNIDADLVTLSACQTGLGSVSRGDEVIGLNRAFFYAGAHTIVSTLWRVDDMASAILVKRFYRNLITDEKAEALRKAQLTLKKRFPHPSFWAGFTLVGDYR